MLRYVVITPARNESRHMRGLIESMMAQSRLPLRWVIVSDASTDGTDEIVESYRRRFGWIELLRMPEKRDRSFAAKVSCFNAGFERVKGLSYDVIASRAGISEANARKRVQQARELLAERLGRAIRLRCTRLNDSPGSATARSSAAPMPCPD